MLLSGWLTRLASQVLSPATARRTRRKGIAWKRQSSATAQITEPLESRVLLTNVTMPNEGQNVVICLPYVATIDNVQVLPATTPSADMLDFGTWSSTVVGGMTIVTRPTIQDNIDEYDENFVLRVTGVKSVSSSGGSSSGGYQSFAENFTGKIIDDDAAPVLRLQRLDGSGNLMPNNIVPERGYPDTARFRVIADHPTAKQAVLTWSTANGTATGTTLPSFDVNQHNQDFRLLSNQSLSLTPWTYGPANSVDVTMGELTVPINNDRWYEGQETFKVNISATLASVNAPFVTVTIDDLEDVPVVYVQTAQSVMENAGNLLVPITLSNPSRFPVSVSYATSDGKAKVTEDYAALSGIANFAVGITTQSVSVAIVNDTTFQQSRQNWVAPEDFFVTLTAPSGSRLTSQVPYNYTYFSNWNGSGGFKETITINDEAAFPMPTTTVSGVIQEGGPDLQLAISMLPNFNYAFEHAQTLKYKAYWNFYDQSAWRWHGGTETIGVCDSEFSAPPVAARTLASGEVTFLPNGQLTFSNLPIPNLPPNGLHDPLRFLTIEFEWVHPDPNANQYNYYYPNPPSMIINVNDDVATPTLTGMTLSPATIYEDPSNPNPAPNPPLPNSATGAVTLSAAWSVPQTISVSVGSGGTATAADASFPTSITLMPRQTIGVFDVTAIHDTVTTPAEGNEQLVIQASPGWGGAPVQSPPIVIVDAPANPPVTGSRAQILPSQAAFVIPSDLTTGEVVAGFRIENGSLVNSSVTTNGVLTADSGHVYPREGMHEAQESPWSFIP